MDEVKKNLAEKLAAVRAEMGSLKADKTNKDQNYPYISADKILERAGDVIAKYGLVVLPGVVSNELKYVPRANKSDRIDAFVTLLFVVTDGGEQTYQSNWIGVGSDYTSPDKAIYKAITSGHKYFLMKLFNIGIGNEDGEHETGEETGSTKTVSNAKTGKLSPVESTRAEIVKIIKSVGGLDNLEANAIWEKFVPTKGDWSKLVDADKVNEMFTELTAYAESYLNGNKGE
jgi:hypothetical protein